MSLNYFIPALVLTLAIPINARADPDLNCEAYAQSAMAQIVESGSLQCGFGGGGWAPDYNAHFNWCRSNGVGIMDISREDQNREAALAQCRQAQPQTQDLGDAGCAVFANTMVGYAGDNIQLGCGFTSARYDDNYQGHFNWCKSVPQAAVSANQAEAQAEIEQCRAGAAANFQCSAYGVRMNDLYAWHNDACSWRADFQPLYPEDHKSSCMAKAGAQNWMDGRENPLRAQITECEKGEVSFVEPRHFGYLVDGCTFDDSRVFCGVSVAENYCRYQGYSKVNSYLTGSASETLRISCFWDIPVDQPNTSLTITPECTCKGDCGYLAFVSCSN